MGDLWSPISFVVSQLGYEYLSFVHKISGFVHLKDMRFAVIIKYRKNKISEVSSMLDKVNRHNVSLFSPLFI
jgi:hypothetical protein